MGSHACAQAERLREILTQLGPAFVKIGQVCCLSHCARGPWPGQYFLCTTLYHQGMWHCCPVDPGSATAPDTRPCCHTLCKLRYPVMTSLAGCILWA